MKSILIADDNVQIIKVLKQYALREGYTVYLAYDGEQALEEFEKREYEVILLDVMMPKYSGFEVCKKIRMTSMVPIIMITAKSEDFDRIMGLDIGADDYIVKPFSPSEVMARIRAILRRVNRTDDVREESVEIGSLQILLDKFQVYISGKEVKLTKKEVEILWLLASNPGRVFSRGTILDTVWGYDYYGDTRTVDTHIKRLRAKLDQFDYDDWDIITVRGVGYKLEATNE